jgi:hypothetical protein
MLILGKFGNDDRCNAGYLELVSTVTLATLRRDRSCIQRDVHGNDRAP